DRRGQVEHVAAGHEVAVEIDCRDHGDLPLRPAIETKQLGAKRVDHIGMNQRAGRVSRQPVEAQASLERDRSPASRPVVVNAGAPGGAAICLRRTEDHSVDCMSLSDDAVNIWRQWNRKTSRLSLLMRDLAVHDFAPEHPKELRLGGEYALKADRECG